MLKHVESNLIVEVHLKCTLTAPVKHAKRDDNDITNAVPCVGMDKFLLGARGKAGLLNACKAQEEEEKMKEPA